MTSAPNKKQMLPYSVLSKILEHKRSSEYPCQLRVSIEPQGEADLQDYYVTMNLVLHENIQSEYKEWIYRTYRRFLNTYVNAHPNGVTETTEENPFFIGGAGTYEGQFGLAFTYVAAFFAFNDEFDQRLHHLNNAE